MKLSNENHPEKREGEKWLTNSERKYLLDIGYKSKRAGNIALNVYGNPVGGLVLVFVSKVEYDEHMMKIVRDEGDGVN